MSAMVSQITSLARSMPDNRPLIVYDAGLDAIVDIVLFDYSHFSWRVVQYESTAVNNTGSYIHSTDNADLGEVPLSDKVYAYRFKTMHISR